jgi:hypothetical protein
VIPLLTFVGSVAASIGFAATVFHPISKRNAPQDGPRFQIVDLFSLVVLWQYGLITAMTLRGGSLRDSDHLFLSGLLVLVLTALWFGLATTLSDRGVRNALKRWMVTCVAAPAGIAATIVLLPSMMMTVLGMSRTESQIDARQTATVVAGCIAAGIVSRAVLGWATRTRDLPAER